MTNTDTFANWLISEVESLGLKWKRIAEELNLAPDRVTWRKKHDSFSYEEERVIRELINELRTNNRRNNDKITNTTTI